MGKTHLYRHYDAEGNLLYVGISLSAIQRLSQHRDLSHWFNTIASVKIETFDTREEALAAETNAIQNENPEHNIRKRKSQKQSRTNPCESMYEATYEETPAEKSGRELVDRLVLFQPVYTPEEVGRVLNVHGGRVKGLISSGELAHVKIPGRAGLSHYGTPYHPTIAVTGWQLIEYLEHLQGKITP